MSKPKDKQTVAERIDNLGGVPKSDLRELVEDWREREEHMASQGVDEWADGIGECADELEELLE